MYKALDSKVGIGLRVFFSSMQHVILSGSVNKIWLNHRSMELRFVNGWVLEESSMVKPGLSGSNQTRNAIFPYQPS